MRSLGGFYTVISEDGTKTECRGRGIFRRDATTLLVGDRCRFEPTEPGCGSITAIAPRKNTLQRPPVANLDRLAMVVSLADPAPNAGSSTSSAASSGQASGSGSVREPSALQGASSPASSSAAPASTQPVFGRVLNAYSGDELVYNKTLGDWRTHNGIDYAAREGEAVPSPVDGSVVLAGADGSWGPVVAVKDSAGRVWRLCGVASPKVKEGDTVSAGQVLGTVGSVSCECAEESHLHLEVKQGDSYLDPAACRN